MGMIAKNSKTPGLEPGVSHGAVNQIRTGDLLLGKETLYQLSYYREHRHSKGAAGGCQRPGGKPLVLDENPILG